MVSVTDPARIWADPKVTFTTWKNGETIPISRADLPTIGYVLAPQSPRPDDPCLEEIKSDGYICKDCAGEDGGGDWMPYSDPCEHDDSEGDPDGSRFG